MKKYDIEIFKDKKWDYVYMDQPFFITLYDFFESCYSPNDSMLISNIINGMKDDKWDERFITSIFIAFYNNYKGDKQAWLNRTMNIIFAFCFQHLNTWIEYELLRITNGIKPTQKQIMARYITDGIIIKSDLTREAMYKQMAEDFGGKWTSYRKLFNSQKSWYSLGT